MLDLVNKKIMKVNLRSIGDFDEPLIYGSFDIEYANKGIVKVLKRS